MAVAMRCSSVFALPNPPRSPLSGQLPGKSIVTGKIGSCLFKAEKFASSGMCSVCQSFPSSLFTHFGINGFRKLEGSCVINQTTSLFCKLANQLPVHQAVSHCDQSMPSNIELLHHKESVSLRFPAIAFLVTNAFILATPFGALAETCEASNSSFNMPVLLFVSLVGAAVGGLLARQRRGELSRLNEQLRQINAALRRQAKIESYAPSLSYAPVGSRISESEVIVDPKKQELITRLKTGKNFLRNQDPAKAFVEFKAALELAQSLSDPIEEKKAARGLGASLQRQGKYREAIKYHSMVLAISERAGELSGNTEAYGAIADCYTELGDLEQAGKFYDKYIARLEAE